jgi:CheY-like chemotaxis protein
MADIQKILVIDDEVAFRDAACEALADLEGVEVVAPDTLNECERIAFATKVAIVLIDNSLMTYGFQPEPWGGGEYDYYRGWQFAKRMKENLPDITRLGFSKGGALAIGRFVNECFSEKKDLESKNPEVREAAQLRLRDLVLKYLTPPNEEEVVTASHSEPLSQG